MLPDIDLFVSRLNCQIRPFIWGPDPDCVAVHCQLEQVGYNVCIFAFKFDPEGAEQAG